MTEGIVGRTGRDAGCWSASIGSILLLRPERNMRAGLQETADDLAQRVARELVDVPHAAGDAPAVEAAPIAELRDIADGRATLDDSHRTKQPDWTHDAVDSGQWPADRLDDHRR